MYDEIAAGVKVKTQDDFANVGIALKTLYVTSVSPTDETAKAIDERAAMGAIGDMKAYIQFKAARAMGDAAAGGGGGEAGSLAGAGVGLGAGVGIGAAMAGAISQAMQGGQQAATPASAAPGAVVCGKCGTANPAGSKFCNNCGSVLSAATKCSKCGFENAVGAKFCNNCGNKL
jgi:membrane protease subunit (stomatin/prohibitin family)